MLRILNGRLLAVLVVAGALTACDDSTTPTTPTTPAPTVTQTFAGTLIQNGAATHSFDVTAAGAVKATLKAVGTDNTLVVGFSIGNWIAATSSCSVVLANDAATGGSVLSGTMTGAGSLCLRMYDVGNIAANAPAGYTVDIEHP
jgi:hypothetical protein